MRLFVVIIYFPAIWISCRCPIGWERSALSLWFFRRISASIIFLRGFDHGIYHRDPVAESSPLKGVVVSFIFVIDSLHRPRFIHRTSCLVETATFDLILTVTSWLGSFIVAFNVPATCIPMLRLPKACIQIVVLT